MTWIDLIQTIKQDLDRRELANVHIRIRALNTIEELIKESFPEIYAHPIILLETDKNNFKEEISKLTTLSGAKSSIINNLYDTLIKHCLQLHA